MDKLEKNVKRAFGAIVAYVVISVVVSVGLLGGAVYVVGHFVAKFW